MGKLVRDKIPTIIEESGKEAVTRILDDRTYEMELYIKLKEEMYEFLDAYFIEDIAEELADMLEVIYALAKVKGIDKEVLEEVRKQKAMERGSFDKKIFLQLVR